MQPLAGTLLIVLVAALAGGACGGHQVSSDDPPWGLDGIDLPDTDEQVAAVFAALPEGIDGRITEGPQPPIARTYRPTSPNPGDSPIYWQIWAENAQERPWTVTEWIAEQATMPQTEASSTDETGNLVWVASSSVAEQQWTAYGLMWANPDGSWLFMVLADSEAGRRRLVEAFITAAGG